MVSEQSPVELFRQELLDSGEVSKLFMDYIDHRIKIICEQEVIEYINALETKLKEERL